MNEWINKRMREWTNEWISEWKSEWICRSDAMMLKLKFSQKPVVVPLVPTSPTGTDLLSTADIPSPNHGSAPQLPLKM
jgi:hypothetical protein